MTTSPGARRAVPILWLVMGIGVFPALAMAHTVVYPRASTPGAYEKYVLRVPNEKNVATTRVELRFPAGARVISFGDVPGWRLETITDSAQNIVAAVWTGSLPAARFVELPFIAVNPRSDAKLVWPVIQTYADGERAEWTGPEDGEHPASTTTIGATEVKSAASAAPASGAPLYLAIAALVLALISLGIALRPAREQGRPA